jgi:DUF971 family protein
VSEILSIQKIWQKSDTVFSIEWNDRLIQNFTLCDLQRLCPCAHCLDEQTGKRMIDPTLIQDDLEAVVIRNVGRYGIRIQFVSGCSMGIYSFDYLRKLCDLTCGD